MSSFENMVLSDPTFKTILRDSKFTTGITPMHSRLFDWQIYLRCAVLQIALFQYIDSM